MYKLDLALNNTQWLICHKTKLIQLPYYVHFLAKTPGKSINPFYPSSYGLNCITAVIL